MLDKEFAEDGSGNSAPRLSSSRLSQYSQNSPVLNPYILHIKHCLDFSFVFSAPLTAWRNLFSATRDLPRWKVPIRLYQQKVPQPACHFFSKKWKNLSSALRKKRTWVQETYQPRAQISNHERACTQALLLLYGTPSKNPLSTFWMTRQKVITFLMASPSKQMQPECFTYNFSIFFFKTVIFEVFSCQKWGKTMIKIARFISIWFSMCSQKYRRMIKGLYFISDS